MMKRFVLTVSILALSAITLSACANSASPSMSKNDETLKKYHWQLQTATNKQQQTLPAFYAGQAQPKIQLDFDANSLHLYGSCNRMAGSYDINPTQITSTHLRSTLMGCSESISQQDHAMAQFFDGQTLNYQLNTQRNTPVLTLTNQQGQVLSFQGQPTAETKYGNQAEEIFLEVSHQTKTCNDGMRQRQCLQVKEVRYNEQGLTTYTAPNWSLFYDNIEGYTHRPDTDNILRIKRYTLNNPPADASKYAYVLDMVVMSAQAK